MNKKYQVFVSSTYVDLKIERQKAMESLLDSDCIPAGMELFPAADEEQFGFIKKVIDNCDYYILILGNRYGSVDSDGISYTEKEFDYAIQQGIKIIALISNNLEVSDEDDALKAKLATFKAKVQAGRLVSFWNDEKDIALETFKAIAHAKANYPAVGWMRADKVQSEDILLELNEARKKIELLQKEIGELRGSIDPIENLAGLDDKFSINSKYKIESGYSGYGSTKHEKVLNLTLADYFAVLAPLLLSPLHDNYFQARFHTALKEQIDPNGYDLSINDADFQTLTLQFKALGLIDYKQLNLTSGGTGLFWNLTEKGEQLMLQLRTIKKDSSKV